jgi:hypothetical protein
LQKIPANWRPPPLVEQIKAVWGAARKVNLDADVPLPQFLCTSPGRMGELVEKIATAPLRLFKRTRPHGVLIARIGSIRAGLIEPIAGGCGANFRDRRSEALGNIMRLMRRELHSRFLGRFCH